MIQENDNQSCQRNFFRITYPQALKPQVLTGNFEIVNLSEKGICLRVIDGFSSQVALSTIDQPIALTIEFEDGNIIKVKGTVSRCWCDIATRTTYIACRLEKGIPYEKIFHDQIKLIRNYRYGLEKDSPLRSKSAV